MHHRRRQHIFQAAKHPAYRHGSTERTFEQPEQKVSGR